MRLLAALVAVVSLCSCAHHPSRAATFQEGINLLLQGDAGEALAVLDRIDPAQMKPAQRDAVACIRKRFLEGAAPAEALPAEAVAVLGAYQAYWRDMMMRRATAPQGEARLLAALDTMPILAGAPDQTSIDAVSAYVAPAMEGLGLHALTGKTQPFYELMIWKKQETAVYDVVLPEERVNVKVVFLDDFASFGWSGFATCEVAQTGGWAKPDALYAVRSSYDIHSEDFLVSYLTHEGQHFADYAKYPRLQQAELEYRAKLAEVAMSRATTAELLAKFAALGGTSRDVPHAFANRQVHLALDGLAPDAAREAATRKLRESTALLQRLGPATVARFLPDS